MSGAVIEAIPDRFWTWAYTVGLISGSAWQGGGRGTYRVSFRGKRPYVLYLRREEWGYPWHWLRYRHWPEMVFGFCGKCGPWQCCGATGYDHAEGCEEDQ
ncbi:MAG: hypothetical protein NUW01_02870 [Gemmatimonadaceae bacterium]|nr:hypothetical protein [Gemmatimonadaceae bacterium]